MLISKWNQGLLLNDSLYYAAQASNNAAGRWFREFWGVEQGAEHAPLTSLVLTPVAWLAPDLAWMRLTMTLIGISIVPLVGLLGHAVGGRRVGVTAALIAALYPNLWMSDSLIMAETISNALIVAALLAAVHHRRRFSLSSAALVGGVVGLAGLARAEVLIFAPLFALVGLRRVAPRAWWPRALLVVASSIVVILPWTAYNLSRFDAPVLISTNEGGTLLGANCPDSYAGPGLGGWSIVCLYDPVERGDEDTSERSRRQRRQAIDYANGNRSRLAIVALARLARAADLYGLSDMVRGDVGEERYEWSVRAGIVGWWVLAPMAAIGWWRRRGMFGLVLAAPAICVLLTTLVFYGSHRLRTPIETALVVCAALFVVGLAPIRRMIDGVVERDRLRHSHGPLR